METLTEPVHFHRKILDNTHAGDLSAFATALPARLTRHPMSLAATTRALALALALAVCSAAPIAAPMPNASAPAAARQVVRVVVGGSLFNGRGGEARPSPIPSPCTQLTRAGIKWRR